MASCVSSARGTQPSGEKRAVFRGLPRGSTHDLDSAGPEKSAAQKERRVRVTLDRERGRFKVMKVRAVEAWQRLRLFGDSAKQRAGGR